MSKFRIAGIAAYLCIAGLLPVCAQEHVTPSAAIEAVNVQVRQANPQNREEWEKCQKEAAEAQLLLVAADNLSRSESLSYAQLLSMAGKESEALPMWRELAAGDDLTARAANRQLMSAAAEAGDFAALEKMIAEHRLRFSATPEDFEALFNPVYLLSSHYAEAGNHDEAIRVVLDEFAWVKPDSTYMSYQFLEFAAKYFEEAVREEEYIALLTQYLDAFRASQARHEALPVPTDENAKRAHIQQSGMWKTFVGATEGLLKRATTPSLIGRAAPDFEFTHFFNTGPLTLASLKGRVVLIDFWANWCGPCKAAFPKLRALQEEFADQGFTVLGVTGFQGRFADNGVNESKLTPERELELTREQIARLQMTWPVAFSTRGCFDEEYGVQGVPTLVLVDKQGIIRFVMAGLNEKAEKDLKELLAKLLSE